MRRIASSKMGFFFTAVVLLWLKTYFVYIFEFNLDIDNSLQQFLLFINPISSALVFLGIALFARGKKAGRWVLIIDFLMSFLVYANIVYFRFNNDYITLPTLTQTSNFGSLGGSILALAKWYDVFYFADFIILLALYFIGKRDWSNSRLRVRKPMTIITLGVIVFTVNLGLAEIDRPQLLKRTFDRNYIVKYLGSYNFTIYDALQSLHSSTQRVLADSSDMTVVENYTKNKAAKPNPKLFGVAKGKNIIKIHLESFQSFLIDYKLHGEEVTPFLNSLVHGKDTDFTYFDNFFHQTGQGKTSDAEFIMDNSLYGLPTGAAFVTKGHNTYQALPAILSEKEGYTSAVLHGDKKSFWNRDEIYKQFGVDKFFDSGFYDMSEDNVINYGLKDKPFFKESMPLLESLKQPFYAHLITLTNHYPYLIDDDDATIDPAETGDASVDRYFQTARYLDESLKEFFQYLKDSGLYKDSVILMYGDHYGISNNHNRAMKEITGETITKFKNAQLQRVPLMMKIPGVKGQGVNHTYGGEIDVMPTLLHLEGLDTQKYITFGTDMFSKQHKQFVPFRNGSFITPKYSYIEGTYYDNDNGEIIEETDKMKELKETVRHELDLSDKVLLGDLLRYYKPTKDWKPVDPSEYMYGKQTRESDNESDQSTNNDK